MRLTDSFLGGLLLLVWLYVVFHQTEIAGALGRWIETVGR